MLVAAADAMVGAGGDHEGGEEVDGDVGGVGRVALGGVEEMEMAERGRGERKEEGMREKIR